MFMGGIDNSPCQAVHAVDQMDGHGPWAHAACVQQGDECDVPDLYILSMHATLIIDYTNNIVPYTDHENRCRQ